MQTTVYQKGPARFDMAGQFQGYPLVDTGSHIKPGLARRLQRYAAQRLQNSGFSLHPSWQVEVETANADLKPSDRYYSVTWKTPQEGEIGIQGILVNRYGWPELDHGPFIDA